MLSRRACLARWVCLGPGTPWPRCARACTRCPSCSRPCSSWSLGSGRSSGSSPQHVLHLNISAPRYLLSLHMVERSGGCVVSEEVTYLNPELHILATYNTSKLHIYTSTHLHIYSTFARLAQCGVTRGCPGEAGPGRRRPSRTTSDGSRWEEIQTYRTVGTFSE